MVRGEVKDQALVKEEKALAGLEAARLAEAPAPAALVEDRREGKEYLEFEKALTSSSFDSAMGPGCMELASPNPATDNRPTDHGPLK